MPPRQPHPRAHRRLLAGARLLAAALLAGAPAVALGSEWLEEPQSSVCVKVLVCDDHPDVQVQLSPEEEAYAEWLQEGIPARADFPGVVAFFGRPPDRVGPEAEVTLGGRKGKARRVTWNTMPGDSRIVPPHVDVYFFDDQAYMFKWWFDTMMKMVQIRYAK